MHEQVKWMLVVIALFAMEWKAGDELGFREAAAFRGKFERTKSQVELHPS